MPVTPTGELALALDHLRQMVAASSTFQALVGHPGDATAAAAFVYMGEGPSNAGDAFAVVWIQRVNADQIAEGSGREYENSGVLMLQLVGTITLTDKQDAYITFLNAVGGVRDDLLGASGSGPPNLNISSFNARSTYRFDDPNAAARSASVYIAIVEVMYRP